MAQQIVFLDLETTGLNPERHGICEIGALFCNANGVIQEAYRSDLDPRPCEIQPQAFEINGFTVGRLGLAPFSGLVLEKFHSKVESGAILAGWNPQFDASFLRALYRRVGIWWPFDYHYLDVWSIFQTLGVAGFNIGKMGVEALAERYDLVYAEDGLAHSALTDIKWTHRLWRWAVEQIKGDHALRQGYARV